MKDMNTIDWIARVLVIIGALNWGLIAINANWNVVEAILGTGVIARIIYALVGLSAIWEIIALFKK